MASQIIAAAPGTNVDELACGAVTWWELSGFVDCDELTNAWLHAGLDSELLPDAPSNCAALKRTLKDVCAGRLLRPIGGAGAWAVVNENREGRRGRADLDYDLEARVWIDDFGNLDFNFRDSVLPVHEQLTLRHRLEAEYTDQLALLSFGEVSSWLVDTANKHCAAVSLRPRGGIYFIPKYYANGLWRRISKVLHKVSGHRVRRMPAMQGTDAIDAVMNAVVREADQLIDAISDDISEANKSDDGMGKRAAKTRVRRCEELMQKLKAYDGLLGKRLNGIRKRVDQTRLNVLELRMSGAA